MPRTHIQAALSLEEASTNSSFEENETDIIVLSGPMSTDLVCSPYPSQILTPFSLPPVANVFPVGEKAIELISPS